MQFEIGSIPWVNRLVRIGGIIKNIFTSIDLALLIVAASVTFARAATVDVQVPF